MFNEERKLCINKSTEELSFADDMTEEQRAAWTREMEAVRGNAPKLLMMLFSLLGSIVAFNTSLLVLPILTGRLHLDFSSFLPFPLASSVCNNVRRCCNSAFLSRSQKRIDSVWFTIAASKVKVLT